jgi:uncharacterized membrane protein
MQKTFFTITFVFLILAGCAEVDSNEAKNISSNLQNATPIAEAREFRGEEGDSIELIENQITLSADAVDDGKAHFYNTTLPDGDSVYFFVVKSSDGKLRAAANGCQVCGKALQGFHQEDDFMVCNTCGNKYPLNKISTEKGGCNPVPISADLEIKNGKVSIALENLEAVRSFFK